MNKVLFSAATGTPGKVYAIFTNSEETTICTIIDELKLFAGADPVELPTDQETPAPDQETPTPEEEQPTQEEERTNP